MADRPGAAKLVFWATLAIGLPLPWIVGIAVKLHLASAGRPTIPWSYFMNVESLVILIPASIWWGMPYIGLAFFGRELVSYPYFGLQSIAARVTVLIGGLLGGATGTVFTFSKVFWEFDPLYIFIPLWIFVLPPMVVGLVVGFLITRSDEKRSRKTE